MTRRIYIAGPMTGRPGLNFAAFNAAAAAMRAAGHHVENPAEINPDPDAKWLDCMRKDIPRLVTCDTICLLPGWSASKGASLELDIARSLGFAVILHQGAEVLA